MKKYISIFIALFLTFGLGACSSDDENTTVNEYDELPAWLIPEAQKMAEEFKNYEGDPTLLYRISRATGIHGETVYHIYRAFDSCMYCNLYDGDGNSVTYDDMFGKRDDVGWKIIFPKKK
jgi:hypothetical protein